MYPVNCPLGVVKKATYCTEEIIEVEDESGNILPECSITQQYFPSHGNEGVRNDVTLDTFGVITGPNASGKTTYLKTTAINVILCQQFGVGFFESCKMRPLYTDPFVFEHTGYIWTRQFVPSRV